MSTRFTLKHYVRLLEEAVREAGESREALGDALEKFFALMRANNDERLIRAVVRRFEERFIARENIGSAIAWFASEQEGAVFAPRLREALAATHSGGALVEQKSDPALIGGVKVLYDNNYLVEASFHRDVENLFARFNS
jgi:F0F1-type ATP synthase delta subunit